MTTAESAGPMPANGAAPAAPTPNVNAPTLGAAFLVWLKIGILSFGGPAGQIAMMHREVVEQRRWIDESRFLHALNYCMLLPGPEAQQLATYIGWLMHRTVGGLISGILFILPGALFMLALCIGYVLYAKVPLVEAAFVGIKAAVLVIVVEALLRIARRAIKTWPMVAMAAIAFLAIFLLGVPFPVIVAAAAAAGYLGGRLRPDLFVVIKGRSAPQHDADTVVERMEAAGLLGHTRPNTARAILVVLVFGALWLGPIAGLWAALGPNHVFTQEALFFSKLAVVTFGGAYAVLAYMAQQAVETYGWLAPAQMLDGLGLAETTPGPLILVTQFVGTVGAFNQPGNLPPLTAAIIGAAVTTWVTFVPCFLWILLGAPYIERLRDNQGLSAALSGITAAVVGVVLNLAVWFGLHVMFTQHVTVDLFGHALAVPVWQSVEPLTVFLAAAAGVAMFRFHQGIVPVLLACAATAMVASLG